MARGPSKPRFPNRLRDLRKARGWTLAQLAAMLNTTAATISRRESGNRDQKAADLEAHLRMLGATYLEAFPGAHVPDAMPPAPLDPEDINRLVDELAVEVADAMPMDRVPTKLDRMRMVRAATTRFRAVVAELMRTRSGKA